MCYFVCYESEIYIKNKYKVPVKGVGVEVAPHCSSGNQGFVALDPSWFVEEFRGQISVGMPAFECFDSA